MHCGQVVGQMKAMPQGQPNPQHMTGAMAAPVFPAPGVHSGKRTTWMAIATALVLVLAVFFGLRAAGVLKVGGSNPKLEALQANGRNDRLGILQSDATNPSVQTLQAQGSDPNLNTLKAQGSDPQTPLFTSQGSAGPAVMEKTAEKVAMPDDIRKWLEHLERIEKRKNELSMKQVADMMVLMQKMKVMGGDLGSLLNDEDTPPPTEQAQSSFNDLKPEWSKLIADFQSYPPPAECKPIADDYYRALSEVPGMMSDIADILTNAASDPSTALQKAYKLQNTSATVIDKYFGQTDTEVGDICRKYETSKWFSIKTDVGGGLMSKFGF